MKEKYKLLILFAIAFLARFIALPFSQAAEADATSRIFLAEHALQFHGELGSLQWPSLHIYFLSLGQWINGDRVTGAVIITLLLGAASVVPFYLFTRNVFNSNGAFYASLLFTFSPLIFRNSFTPLSEIYHVFFSMTAMWLLTEGILRQDKKIMWAALAGAAATIACGGRFEAWIMCGLLGVILLVMREWKMFFVFGAVSAIFPVWWMIFCYRHSGDPFISLEMVRHQNLDIGRINDHLDTTQIRMRQLFFPFSWLIAVTPVIAIIILGLFPKMIRRIKTQRLQFSFFCLFLVFIAFFFRQSLNGTLANQHRYTISLVMLSLPVFSLWFEKGDGKYHWKAVLSVLIAAVMIPWSFNWYRVPWHWMACGEMRGTDAIARIVTSTYREMYAIPRLNNPQVTELTAQMKKEIRPGEGLYIDFWEWNESYYVHQQAPVGVDVYSTYDLHPHHGDHGMMRGFFSEHRTGMIVISDYSSLSQEISLHGPVLEFDSMPGALLVEPRTPGNWHCRLLRYRYLPPEEAQIQRQKFNFTPPVYTFEKDIDYYMFGISNNAEWMCGLYKNLPKSPRNMQEQIRFEAEYAMKQDREKEQHTPNQ